MKVKSEWQYGTVSKQIRNEEFYFTKGIAFAAIGTSFAVRAHRFSSVFSNVGLSLFPLDIAGTVAALATQRAARIVNDLAPGMRFDVGDVNRLPLFPIANADEIFATLEAAFTLHESHRETSVEFRHPGPSPWDHAQQWAQLAVDRPEGAPLAPYTPVLVPEPPIDHLSYALGIALGRFGPHGEGILDPATADLSHALPDGILFLSALPGADETDGLSTPAAAPLHQAWAEHGRAIAGRRLPLRDWLRLKHFTDDHLKRYSNTPIHWPLSSANTHFVAWITIHRWTAHTLKALLARSLEPEARRLDAMLADIADQRGGAGTAAREADKADATLLALREELQTWIADVRRVAEQGPAPTSQKCPRRQADAPYDPVLDDGVMINAAALWELLAPQWSKPKKWWTELATASGRKDYDWSQLARRYFPRRVDDKCKADPSLGVAHACFWKYHPAKAFAWELRLQDGNELGPDFVLDEAADPRGPDATTCREAFMAHHPAQALELVEAEVLRRARKERRRAAGEDEAPPPPPDRILLPRGTLWQHAPEACLALEHKLFEKLEVDFTLDEPGANAARAKLGGRARQQGLPQ